MFDNLKKLAELKKLQDSFKKEKITVEKNGVKVVMNGNLDIEEVKLNPDVPATSQERDLLNCINEAKDKMQKTLAQKMMGSGFGF